MITIGDIVNVIVAKEVDWSDGSVFPAKLLSTPQGPGDCFSFELPNGSTLILNGNSSEFVGIQEIKS